MFSSLLLPLLFWSGLHDFHVSRCLIHYAEEESSLQITLHVFLDDLEEALSRRGAEQLFLGTELEKEGAGVYVERYLRQQFEIRINGKQVEYVYLGRELSDDLMGLWCYLEITSISEFREISIRNQILMEVFDDQKNIIQLEGPSGKKGSMLFNQGKTEATVHFK